MTVTNRIRRLKCRLFGHVQVAHWSYTGGAGMKCLRCEHVTWFGYGPGMAAYYYQVPVCPSVSLGDAS